MYCVQSLQTLGKLQQVEGSVAMTLDKLPAIRGDLVRTDPDWENWDYGNLAEALRQWTRRRNLIDHKATDEPEYKRRKRSGKFGILRNPDRTRTRTWTRTRRKPGLSKIPDSCSDSRLRNPDSTIENPDSKSNILDSMKMDSDNIRNPEYIPIFNCLSETYNRNSII